MKATFLMPLLLLQGFIVTAQTTASSITAFNLPEQALAPLRYLASDRLKGRSALRPEIDTAATYISEQFASCHVKQVPGAHGYFQEFFDPYVTPSSRGNVTLGGFSFSPGNDALQFEAGDLTVSAPTVYIKSLTKEKLASADVKGKIVVTDMASQDQGVMMADFIQSTDQQKMLQQSGATALVKIFSGDPQLWEMIKDFAMKPRMLESSGGRALDVVLVKLTPEQAEAVSKSAEISGSIHISGTDSRSMPAKNLIGYIEGTDPRLKDQYIVLSSHYDHIGVAPEPKMEEGKMDSIYNGARDNAIGTTAVIDAARYFSKHPARRSILFICYTAEEQGLIGSEYYAAHPLVPLNKTVYNLNIDNASYDDTGLISLVGLGRTTADSSIIKACRAFGLRVNGDPTGGSLFFESDNYPLAMKGVPAPTYSLGMKAFDEEVMKRYHQLSDEVDNMDLKYAMKFINAYILSAMYIADSIDQPRWVPNDPLAKEWQRLFAHKQ